MTSICTHTHTHIWLGAIGRYLQMCIFYPISCPPFPITFNVMAEFWKKGMFEKPKQINKQTKPGLKLLAV